MVDNFDLNELRGSSGAVVDKLNHDEPDDDLNALSELVPHLKSRKTPIAIEDDSSPEGQELKHVEASGGGGGTMHIPSPSSPRRDGPKMTDKRESYLVEDDSSSGGAAGGKDINDVLYAGEDVNSEEALSSDDHSKPRPPDETNDNLGLGEFQNISSGQSLSTATQTHEVRMPMYLPTFKPATGCTNASDFIVRCFVARLRSGITVVKHGRSRWCKSRLRVLHIHPDGRSLSWKPAQGEPTSSKRPPKLDLTTCMEVRHAWSPDPQNPMYTGTPILRQKCEAANAHKSFALIFPKRTVDITSVTADQCKVLMEGFSALCFRLQVANLAGKGNGKGVQKMPDEEDDRATTASATLTNNSANLSPHNRR
ncbi:hypothetical protein IV203_009241 [Nitzschia inconspicua]|uniref:Uncharacterized protein n=1 Tax=Nitzschia inconspicua TaxID=303405 RepID=A0A9K3L0A1_9STRA|nr:hypothetical protein IV203_011048 [Nitzschia inconspicua]KAG7353192.1 hypothetical protein IV203_009241 [Nitzschia inconspicua]